MDTKARDKIKQIDFEIKFFEKLIKNYDNFTDALMPLAENYTVRGLYKKGLAVDKKLSQIKPDDPIVWYNLACSLALTGSNMSAIKALKKSIELGYCDYEHMVHDKDLDSIKQDVRFKKILQEIRGTNNKINERVKPQEEYK